MYDLIGDIHGHADALEAWLRTHGYEPLGKGYRHPERTLIFLGDLIDRGKQVRRVVEIARAMVDSGAAKVIMGNHEFNALCFHTPDRENKGQYLRAHTELHVKQHRETLAAFAGAGEMNDLLGWLYTLPMWLELPELRAIHACWHPQSLDQLRERCPEGLLNPELLVECAKKGGVLYEPIENILKGLEVSLPPGFSFKDKEGHERRKVRIKWCAPSQGQTFRRYSFPEQLSLPDTPIEGVDVMGYPHHEKPVFFGHYWLRDAEPSPVTSNAFCLDYSVAAGGFLCGYRMGQGFLVTHELQTLVTLVPGYLPSPKLKTVPPGATRLDD